MNGAEKIGRLRSTNSEVSSYWRRVLGIGFMPTNVFVSFSLIGSGVFQIDTNFHEPNFSSVE